MEAIKKIEIEEIVKGIPGGFFIYYANGAEEIIYANQEVVYLYGCDTRDEFLEYTNGSFKGMVHPEDLERVEKSIADQIAGNPRNFDYVEYRALPKGGGVKWIEDFGHFVKSDIYGEVFYVFITDVTEKMERNIKQKKRLMNLAIDQELLRKSLESTVYSFVKVYMINLRDGYSREIYPDISNEENKKYIDAIDAYITPENVMEEEGRRLRILLQPEHLQKALVERDSVEYRYRRKLPDSSVEWCVMVFTVSDRDKGLPITVTLGIRSIEKLIQKENQQRLLLESAFMRARQASEAKTIFLANMSHDIRTPMNAVVGFAELGLRHGNSPEKMRECLRKIQDSSQVLLRLIDDILDMSRIEADRLRIEPESYDLLEIMPQVYQMVEKEIHDKGLKFSYDFSGIKDRVVFCDPTRMKQVLYNLVGNAVKFTPAGGKIDVRISQYESLSNGIENYEFIIRDTGIGIASEFLAKIFIPFEREKNTTVSGSFGVGLGLPITKNIVDLMNGSIETESEVGKGSTFIVRIPFQVVREMEEHEAHVREDQHTFSGLAGKQVLLVEDNELNREIARELLEEYHLLVDEAEDGDIALEMLQNGEKEYDVILMDIQMPRMNGYEATKAIRGLSGSKFSRIPIIALSANAFEEDKRMAISSGMNHHLSKPMDIEKVLCTMQQLLDAE
ncbi:MAG: response regulator [Lachnospiraceae bacterium]|nr:response regulator [Lachnospiraceae bacterium]